MFDRVFDEGVFDVRIREEVVIIHSLGQSGKQRLYLDTNFHKQSLVSSSFLNKEHVENLSQSYGKL